MKRTTKATSKPLRPTAAPNPARIAGDLAKLRQELALISPCGQGPHTRRLIAALERARTRPGNAVATPYGPARLLIDPDGRRTAAIAGWGISWRP